MMTPPYRICTISGDGIGPEIMREAKRVLEVVGVKSGYEFIYEDVLLGGCAIDETGNPLPPETLEAAKRSDAVLLAAVGGPKWDTTDPNVPRPEQGLLGIRKGLGLYANLRPVKVFDALIDSSTVKPEIIRRVDIMIVRELTGGMYFGERGRHEDYRMEFRDGTHGHGVCAYDTEIYGDYEVERIVRKACELARARGTSNVCSVDKANVLESSRLWREVAHKTAIDYPEIELWDQLVDNCAMQLVKNPRQFDVLVTSNMFGDILSDEASMLSGSLGMLPSASLNELNLGMYEPAHGSAPGLVGKDEANPLAMILSVAMMFRYSLGLPNEADAVERAVDHVLEKGWRTQDIASDNTAQCSIVGTRRMGELVARQTALEIGKLLDELFPPMPR